MAVVDVSIDQPYPGTDLGAEKVLILAETFRTSALHLLDACRTTKSKSWAPFRLLSIHAIELYLNTYLLQQGTPPSEIRGMQHDLAKRAILVQQNGLVLRSRTAEHLKSLSKNREYLVSRYALADANILSQINRLQATMEEVRNRVSQKIEA